MPSARQRRTEVEVARDGVEGNGQDPDPSVAAEGRVLMIPADKVRALGWGRACTHLR